MTLLSPQARGKEHFSGTLTESVTLAPLLFPMMSICNETLHDLIAELALGVGIYI